VSWECQLSASVHRAHISCWIAHQWQAKGDKYTKLVYLSPLGRRARTAVQHMWYVPQCSMVHVDWTLSEQVHCC
jgi:hypothetical protein